MGDTWSSVGPRPQVQTKEEQDEVNRRVSSSPGPQGNRWLGKYSEGAGVQVSPMWSHRFGGLCYAYILAPLWQFCDGDVSGWDATVCVYRLPVYTRGQSGFTSGHLYVQ